MKKAKLQLLFEELLLFFLAVSVPQITGAERSFSSIGIVMMTLGTGIAIAKILNYGWIRFVKKETSANMLISICVFAAMTADFLLAYLLLYYFSGNETTYTNLAFCVLTTTLVYVMGDTSFAFITDEDDSSNTFWAEIKKLIMPTTVIDYNTMDT